jgi:hypothetical protein
VTFYPTEELVLEESYHLDVKEITIYLDELIEKSDEDSLVNLAKDVKAQLLSRHQVKGTGF